MPGGRAAFGKDHGAARVTALRTDGAVTSARVGHRGQTARGQCLGARVVPRPRVEYRHLRRRGGNTPAQGRQHARELDELLVARGLELAGGERPALGSLSRQRITSAV